MFRLLCTFVMLLVVTPVFSASVEDLNLRIKKLEQENRKIKSQHKAFKKEILATIEEGSIAQDLALDLEKQFATNMKISGYADVEYVKSSKVDDTPGFRMHHFSLFFTQKISEKWSLFSEIEYEDGPNFEGGEDDQTVVTPDTGQGQGTTDVTTMKSSSGKIFLEAMNLDFRVVPALNIRIGRFFTPAGIWSIDHYPPFVTTQERPMHIRKIFPQIIDGLMSYGRIEMGGTFLRYDIYVGNGENAVGNGDRDGHKSSGLRVALEIPLLTKFELGVSSYEDTLKNEEVKTVNGYHVKIQWKVIDFQAEYAVSDHTTAANVEFFREGFYTQLSLRLGKHTTGIRNDFFNDYKEVTSVATGKLQYETTKNSIYYNYRITKDVVLKLEHHQIKNDVRIGGDYKLSIGTIAVNLGN